MHLAVRSYYMIVTNNKGKKNLAACLKGSLDQTLFLFEIVSRRAVWCDSESDVCKLSEKIYEEWMRDIIGEIMWKTKDIGGVCWVKSLKGTVKQVF